MLEPVIGLIVPHAAGEVPAETQQMYPSGVRFIARGLGLGELTPAGYDSVIDKAEALARELADAGAQAIVLMGTSLTFYRGADFNAQLIRTMHEATGLPATTMSTGVVEALRAVGARRVAVGTAYIDEVNQRLRQFLVDSGFEVLSLEGLGISQVGQARFVSDDRLVELGERAAAEAREADAVLISCGGLRTLNITVPIEEKTGLPVVSSTPAASWAAVRLVGQSGRIEGFGKLLSVDHALAEAG